MFYLRSATRIFANARCFQVLTVSADTPSRRASLAIDIPSIAIFSTASVYRSDREASNERHSSSQNGSSACGSEI